MTTLSTIHQQAEEGIGGNRAQKRRCVMQVTWSLVAGGAETYAMTVASGLDPASYRVVMCGVDKGGALEPEIQRRGIPYHIMNRREGLDWRLMWRMFQLFRREKVDVIHTHHFNQLFYSLAAAKVMGIRIIHTEHSIEAYKKRHLRWVLKAMSLVCHRVTAIGADGEKTLRDKVGISSSKLQVIRAAVDLSRFDGISREAARANLGLKPEDKVAVIVARLYPEKNHHLLLDAFREVLNRVPDARLLIVGDGIEQESIRGQVEHLGLGQQVQMLGVRRDIPEILAASDLFVLCSDREGLPIAVLEAMAASLPVVATRVGDLPLVVQDSHTGLLVEPGSVAGLATAMAQLLSDAETARQFGKAGRGLVEQQYSLSQMVAQHQQLYGGSG